MALIIHKSPGENRFVLKRTLHLTADDKVVEENDASGIKVLGGAGGLVTQSQVVKYGLDESHLESEPEPAEPSPKSEPSAPEAVPEAKPKKPAAKKAEEPEG